MVNITALKKLIIDQLSVLKNHFVSKIRQK
jgi:hypothetical protein